MLKQRGSAWGGGIFCGGFFHIGNFCEIEFPLKEIVQLHLNLKIQSLLLRVEGFSLNFFLFFKIALGCDG